MNTYTISTTCKKILADTLTPVSIYLRLRDRFPHSVLLESSDNHSHENSYSYICCQPVAGIKIENDKVTEYFPDGEKTTTPLLNYGNVANGMRRFMERFRHFPDATHPFLTNGLFGYNTYDAVQYFEDITLHAPRESGNRIPDICYQLYRFVIVVNHFKNELFLFEHSYGEKSAPTDTSLSDILHLLNNKSFPVYPFQSQGKESSNVDDAEFLQQIKKVKEHIRRGDVFQLVLSRQFRQAFTGDEFNVYRALRSINPSPYLFYFDYGDCKIFGSSPEAQLVIKNRVASIYPIAGTFRRTGNHKTDEVLAEQLLSDPKENAEHVMLVDLARNDLSRNSRDVHVEVYREIQFYSHVIHLVSKVSGTLHNHQHTLQLVADTFPAGTLSGAPKYKAVQLIDQYENTRRGFYGGSIGFIGFNGDYNHAITIRSFLSKDNILYYQAGAGVVESSKPENELQEVYNKLFALKSAIKMAETL